MNARKRREETNLKVSEQQAEYLTVMICKVVGTAPLKIIISSTKFDNFFFGKS